MIRVVFDCMVFLQAAGKPNSPANACLQLAYDGLVQLFVSNAVIAEVQDVCQRPQVRRRFPLLTDEMAHLTVRAISESSTMVDPVPERYSLERDRKDSPYLDLAIATDSSYVVTRDNDMLDLMDESKPGAADFKKLFPALQIVDPVHFLRIVRSQEYSTGK